jgi:hypothetical protein
MLEQLEERDEHDERARGGARARVELAAPVWPAAALADAEHTSLEDDEVVLVAAQDQLSRAVEHRGHLEQSRGVELAAV